MIQKLIVEDPYQPEILRQVAEQRLKASRPPVPPVESEKLLHELQIHQIELEMQIESLRKTQSELEVALKTSDRLFAFAPIPYLIISHEGRILTLNHAATFFFHEPEKSLCSKQLQAFIPESEHESFRQHLDAIIESESPEIHELQLCIQGQPHWVLLNLIADPDHPRILLAIEDVEDAELKEHNMVHLNQALESSVAARTEELYRSEERYRLALSTSGQGLLDYNVQTGKVVCNATYFSMLGYPCDALGNDIQDVLISLLPPEERDTVFQTLMQTLTATGRHQTEFRLRAHDGSYRWIQGRGEIIQRDRHDQPVRIIWTHTDITAQKQSSMANARLLTQAEQRYQTLIEAIQEGLWIVDHSGRITFANQTLCTMLGLPVEELLGHHWLELVADDWKASLEKHLSEPGQTPTAYPELILKTRGEQPLWVMLVTTPITQEDGTVNSSLGLLMDISHNRRQAAQIQQQLDQLTLEDERKTRFLAVLSHELRNPLAPICTAADLLKQSGLNSTDIQWCQQIIERQTSQLKRLLDALLDVSRINTGKISILPASVPLTDIIDQAIETSQPAITRRQHRLIVELPEEPLEIPLDRARVSQVLGNLLDNAAKFTPPGGTITLTVETIDQQLVIRVRDTGIGIAPENQTRIFELYTQLDDPMLQTGLGIGLNLSSQIIALHGGTLKVHSAGPGQGSEFSISLPCKPPRAPHDRTPPIRMSETT